LLKRPPAIQVQGDLIARIAVGSWAGHWWMPEPMRLARRSSAREGPVTALKSTERFPDSVLRPNPIDRPNSAHGGPILGLPAKYGRSEEAPGNIRGLDFRAATVGLWAAIVRPSRGHLDSHLRKGMPDFGSTAVSSSPHASDPCFWPTTSTRCSDVVSVPIERSVSLAAARLLDMTRVVMEPCLSCASLARVTFAKMNCRLSEAPRSLRCNGLPRRSPSSDSGKRRRHEASPHVFCVQRMARRGP